MRVSDRRILFEPSKGSLGFGLVTKRQTELMDIDVVEDQRVSRPATLLVTHPLRGSLALSLVRPVREFPVWYVRLSAEWRQHVEALLTNTAFDVCFDRDPHIPCPWQRLRLSAPL
jgi:hypothetical protein